MAPMLRHRHAFLVVLCTLLASTCGQLTIDQITKALKCDRPDSFGPAKVIVEHQILEKTFTNPSELDALAQTFKDVYNKMNTPRVSSKICDKDHARAVTRVRVEPMELKYKRYPGQEGYYREFLYTAHGKCRDCAKDTSLFEKGRGRTKNNVLKLVDSGGAGCQCSSTVTKENARGPTEPEFKKAFKDAVSKLAFDENGKLLKNKNTEDTDNVNEVEGGWCPKNKDNMNFEVTVKLSKAPGNFRDLEAVQDAYINSYSHMAPKYCDPKSHTVTEVTLTTKNRNNGERLFRGLSKGTCNRCGSESGYFDDGGRRLDEYDHEEARRLWLSSGCYCSIYPEGYRRPTSQEHADRFNSTLKWAFRKGYLSEPIYVMRLNDAR